MGYGSVALEPIAAGDVVAAFGGRCVTRDEFECACGSAQCRGKVSGHDWMLPELQLRYRGSFSPYLAKRIAALVSVGAERRAFAL